MRVAPRRASPEAGGQVADGLAQVAGQQPEHPAERQAVDVDRADPRRVGIQVPQLGQGGARASHLGGADGDQGARLAGGRRVQAAGAQRLPPEGHHLLPVPQQRVGASQPVGDQGGQRLAVRVVPRLRQRLAELPFRLAELARGERHRAQHAAAQRGRRRRLHRLAQGQAPGLLGQHQVQRGGQQPPFPVGPGRGDVRGPLQVGGGQRQAAACRLLGRQPLQLGGQALIRLVQGGHPVLPRRRLADQDGGAGVQHAAPGGRDAGVDGVPDQRVADRHRAGWVLPATSPPGRRPPPARSPRWASSTCRRLAQLRQRHAQVQHRQHLQDDPGLGQQPAGDHRRRRPATGAARCRLGLRPGPACRRLGPACRRLGPACRRPGRADGSGGPGGFVPLG